MATGTGAYGGRSTVERVAERRRRLLAATLEVWGREGGPRVTMTRVCREAGLTERYFYESFAGLEAALVAVLDGVADEIAERTVTALEATTGGPTERVRAAIAAFVALLVEDPRKGRVAIVESMSSDALRPHRTRLLQRFAELSAHEARALYGPEATSEVEGRLAATMFVGGLAELVTAWIEGRVEATSAEVVDAATRHFTATARR